MNWERRLPPVAEEALDVLDKTVGDDNDGLPKDETKAVLIADDRFTEGDAEYALDVLQNRGHIYYVDERVYITPDRRLTAGAMESHLEPTNPRVE